VPDVLHNATVFALDMGTLLAGTRVELIRFDMSEYIRRAARLCRVRPGLLTDGVDQHPHSVLLLDEIEKAHPDLFNVLLQIMVTAS